jgi:hypothetical protein
VLDTLAFSEVLSGAAFEFSSELAGLMATHGMYRRPKAEAAAALAALCGVAAAAPGGLDDSQGELATVTLQCAHVATATARRVASAMRVPLPTARAFCRAAQAAAEAAVDASMRAEAVEEIDEGDGDHSAAVASSIGSPAEAAEGAPVFDRDESVIEAVSEGGGPACSPPRTPEPQRRQPDDQRRRSLGDLSALRRPAYNAEEGGGSEDEGSGLCQISGLDSPHFERSMVVLPHPTAAEDVGGAVATAREAAVKAADATGHRSLDDSAASSDLSNVAGTPAAESQAGVAAHGNRQVSTTEPSVEQPSIEPSGEAEPAAARAEHLLAAALSPAQDESLSRLWTPIETWGSPRPGGSGNGGTGGGSGGGAGEKKDGDVGKGGAATSAPHAPWSPAISDGSAVTVDETMASPRSPLLDSPLAMPREAPPAGISAPNERTNLSTPSFDASDGEGSACPSPGASKRRGPVEASVGAGKAWRKPSPTPAGIDAARRRESEVTAQMPCIVPLSKDPASTQVGPS